MTDSWFSPTTPVRHDAPARDIYSVGRLNAEARAILERTFAPSVWVEGELSNFARPASGHWYFSLKDANAQVRCAMFRPRTTAVGFIPENGAHVLIRAKVSLYENRGEFQLVAEYMEEAGAGALQRAFEQLKQKLAAEGLFDPAHKKPLPAFARCIGVVTSPTGAALRDILSVVRRRFPGMHVIIYPTAVQGEQAAAQIARAITAAGRRDECDALIVARGGGSMEDLWSFNDEAVARAIYACPLPVVSGVGHEVDFTIADFVADVRAPTPTAAAELLTPDQQAWLTTIARQQQRLRGHVQNAIKHKRRALDWLVARLAQQHPRARLQQRGQRLDDLEQRLLRAHHALLRQRVARLHLLAATLQRHSPQQRLLRWNGTLAALRLRLVHGVQRQLVQQRHRLTQSTRALDAISPLATLGRGYAVVQRIDNGAVVMRTAQLKTGDALRTRLQQGSFACTVTEVVVNDAPDSQ